MQCGLEEHLQATATRVWCRCASLESQASGFSLLRQAMVKCLGRQEYLSSKLNTVFQAPGSSPDHVGGPSALGRLAGRCLVALMSADMIRPNPSCS